MNLRPDIARRKVAEKRTRFVLSIDKVRVRRKPRRKQKTQEPRDD